MNTAGAFYRIVFLHGARHAGRHEPGPVQPADHLLLLAGLAGQSMSIKLFETSEHYTLMSIPFFVLAGALDEHRRCGQAHGGVCHCGGGPPARRAGHCRILACMLFAAVSGSSPATVVAIGSIVIAGMVKNGYPMEFGAGVICNAGTLGILIPPSIVMVVYAAVTEVSVGRMFMAGVVPGLVLGFMLMAAVWWRAGKLKTRRPKASMGEMIKAFP
jgi:C4-dicarboxylate transporter DctM subunit